MSGLVPLLWAFKVAPVKDGIEKLVLQCLADAADEDGCNAYIAQATIAERAMIDGRTVRRRLAELEERGIIRRGDQRAVAHLPADKRPVVWDVMIPYAAFGDGIDSVNSFRKGKGRPPITPENRPPLAPAPDPKARKDKGQTKVKDREDSETGGTSSPAGQGVPPVTDAAAAGLEDRARPDLKSDNPPPTHLPHDLPQGDAADKSTAAEQPTLVAVAGTGGASSIRATGKDEIDAKAREITTIWIDFFQEHYSPILGSSRVFHSLRTSIGEALKAGYTPDEIKTALYNTNGPGKAPESCPSKAQLSRTLTAVRTNQQRTTAGSVESVHRMDPMSADAQRRANAW